MTCPFGPGASRSRTPLAEAGWQSMVGGDSTGTARVVGLGRLGTKVARLCAWHGRRGVEPDAERADALGVRGEQDELFSADVVMIHTNSAIAAGTRRIRGAPGDSPDGILVNTSRRTRRHRRAITALKRRDPGADSRSRRRAAAGRPSPAQLPRTVPRTWDTPPKTPTEFSRRLSRTSPPGFRESRSA